MASAASSEDTVVTTVRVGCSAQSVSARSPPGPIAASRQMSRPPPAVSNSPIIPPKTGNGRYDVAKHATERTLQSSLRLRATFSR